MPPCIPPLWLVWDSIGLIVVHMFTSRHLRSGKAVTIIKALDWEGMDSMACPRSACNLWKTGSPSPGDSEIHPLIIPPTVSPSFLKRQKKSSISPQEYWLRLNLPTDTILRYFDAMFFQKQFGKATCYHAGNGFSGGSSATASFLAVSLFFIKHSRRGWDDRDFARFYSLRISCLYSQSRNRWECRVCGCF